MKLIIAIALVLAITYGKTESYTRTTTSTYIWDDSWDNTDTAYDTITDARFYTWGLSYWTSIDTAGVEPEVSDYKDMFGPFPESHYAYVRLRSSPNGTPASTMTSPAWCMACFEVGSEDGEIKSGSQGVGGCINTGATTADNAEWSGAWVGRIEATGSDSLKKSGKDSAWLSGGVGGTGGAYAYNNNTGWMGSSIAIGDMTLYTGNLKEDGGRGDLGVPAKSRAWINCMAGYLDKVLTKSDYEDDVKLTKFNVGKKAMLVDTRHVASSFTLGAGLVAIFGLLGLAY